jgi:hypothetical protein
MDDDIKALEDGITDDAPETILRRQERIAPVLRDLEVLAQSSLCPLRAPEATR